METASPKSIDVRLIEIKPFDRKDGRTAFSCGRDNMDSYLQHSAETKHQKRYERVYVACHEEQIIGFYSLSAASRKAETMSEAAYKLFERIDQAPIIYLGMLAVHEPYKGRGLGQKLMIDAMKKTLQVADLVGVYALVLDAADEEVARRYEKWGFEFFKGGLLRMFIPLGKIRDAVKKN